MNEQTITVTLPNSVYERIRITARATSLTSEEVVKQSVILSLPAFETDIPQNMRSGLAKLSMLSDIQLLRVANSIMEESRQSRLEQLAESRKNRDLSASEQSELDTLMDEARQIMLRKAEARRHLAQRGHSVFTPKEV